MPDSQDQPLNSGGEDKEEKNRQQSLYKLDDFSFGAPTPKKAEDKPAEQVVPSPPQPKIIQPQAAQEPAAPQAPAVPQSGPIEFVEEPFSWDDEAAGDTPAAQADAPGFNPFGQNAPSEAAPATDTPASPPSGGQPPAVVPAASPFGAAAASPDAPPAAEGATIVIPPGQLPADPAPAPAPAAPAGGKPSEPTMVMQPGQVGADAVAFGTPAAGTTGAGAAPFGVDSQQDTDATLAMAPGSLPGVSERHQLPALPGASVADRRIAKLAIESGLATDSQVNICLDAIARTADDSTRPPLADVLVEKGVLTDEQAHSLREVSKAGSDANLLGGYQILEKIGEGGMGAVYKARQINLDRVVALKILPDQFAANTEFLNRFLREAKSGGKLDHPNIVRAIDAGKAAGKYYFAMELVEGQSVEALLEKEYKLPEERALPIIIQAARGLEAAWRNDLVHRDIKPDNILLTTDNVAKLADLGLAKANQTPGETRLTQDGAAMGTPHYISPEQARGVDVDIRSDIYSLGITYYRMITGKFPFDGKDPVSIIMSRFSERCPPANEADPLVSDEASEVIETMMALDKEVRYPDPAVLLHDLELLAAGDKPQFASANQTARQKAIEAARSRGTSSMNLGPIFVKRRRRLERAMIGLGALAIAGAVIAVVLLTRPEPQQIVMYKETAGPAGTPAKPSPEDEKLKALEKDAAAFFSAREKEFGESKYKEVVQSVDAAGTKYAATSKAMAITALRTQAAEKLREIETEAKEAARLEADYKAFIAEARVKLSEGDYARATGVLIRAKAIKDTEEVAELLIEASFIRFMTLAKDAEKSDKFLDAISLYEKAIEVKASDAATARIAELKRVLDFRARLAEGDEQVERKSWKDALSTFTGALEVANDEEKETVHPRIARVKAELAYDEAVAGAEQALEGERPDEALRLARSAAKMRPDETRPGELVIAARRAIGPDETLTDELGIEFILIPAGEFLMGTPDGDADEKPQRRVHLDAYYISKHEITNEQYEKCGQMHNRTEYSRGDDMPVVAVSWDDATTYCRWLGQNHEGEYTLPTEAQWEKAARGTGGIEFPWGNEPARSADGWRANIATSKKQAGWDADGHKYAAPVGSFEDCMSPYGVMDMAGNVWEWCLDWYAKDYYTKEANRNPTGPGEGAYRVYRGGSFANLPASARCGNRAGQKQSFVEASIGFRIVRALDPIFREEPPAE